MTISSTNSQQQLPSLQSHGPVATYNQLQHRAALAQARPGPQGVQKKLYQTNTQILGEMIQAARDPICTNVITSFPVVRDQLNSKTIISEVVSEESPTTEEDVSVIIKNKYLLIQISQCILHSDRMCVWCACTCHSLPTQRLENSDGDHVDRNDIR